MDLFSVGRQLRNMEVKKEGIVLTIDFEGIVLKISNSCYHERWDSWIMCWKGRNMEICGEDGLGHP